MTDDPGDPQIKTVRERAEDAANAARDRATKAREAARDRALQTRDIARERGKAAAEKAERGISDSPIAAVAGGIAIGAILAGLLPRTGAEDRAVGNVGRKVRSTARDAAKNLRESAREQLDEFGLDGDSARQKLTDIARKIGKAASNAGLDAAKKAVGKS